MYLVLSRDMDNVVIHVQFPATLEEVRRDISRLDEHSAGTGPVQIIDTSSCAKNLTGYIKRADLDSETDIKKLSKLAKQIDSTGWQGWTSPRQCGPIWTMLGLVRNTTPTTAGRTRPTAM